MIAKIHDHAVVGDGRSAALISRSGSLDWLCWPQFDSPSLFAAILDEERGGSFSISPAGSFRSERAYLHETNVLRTRFRCAGGELGVHAHRADQRRPLLARPPGAHRPGDPGGADVNWPAALLAGFVGTLVLTSLEAGAQQLHLTRMSLPYLLGTAFTGSRERAKVIGFFAHLINGQLFALLYVAIFHVTGHGGALWGAIVGLIHAVVVLLVVVPLLPSIHPRMASAHQGPTSLRQIEPPGPLALHYGFSTPLTVVLAHVVFGMVVGALS